jgi:hypothetical protein
MERSEMRTGVGGADLAQGVSYEAPHPGLCFASAFPPHRFAGGGIRGSAFKCDSPPPLRVRGHSAVSIDQLHHPYSFAR